MDPRRRNTWVTTILETEDWPELLEADAEVGNRLRSKLAIVGEVKFCWAKDGEKVAGLEDPPPPLLPPPPPV